MAMQRDDQMVTVEFAPWTETFAAVVARVAARCGCTELPGWALAASAWIVVRFGIKVRAR